MDLQKTALQRVVTGADGPSIRSAPVPIPARATCAQGLIDGPPSPTASISEDKYVLVRAPKPQFRVRQLAEADVKADIVKSVSAIADQVSELRTPLYRPMATAAKSVMRNSAKMQMLRCRIPYSFALTSAVTGVATAVAAISPDSNSTEWAAFAALYDEFRVAGFDCEYFVPAISPAGGTGGVTIDSAHVLAYDPVDSTALTSVRQGTEASRHTLKMPSPVLGTATTSATQKYGFIMQDGKPFSLKVRFPKGKAEALALGTPPSTIVASPGQWKLVGTAGTNSPDGWLKVYHVSDYTTTAVDTTGIVYVDVEFRSRR